MLVRFLFLTLTLLCTTLTVHANDLRWSGFNVGINTGVLVNRSTTDVTGAGDFLQPPFLDNNLERSAYWKIHNVGATVGVQLGYNYQVGHFVCGLEADFNASSLSKIFYTYRVIDGILESTFEEWVEHKIPWFGTLRPRIGFDINNILCIYATGGLLYGQVRSSTNILYRLDPYVGEKNKIKANWTAGCGMEGSINDRLSLRAEYLYLNFGKFSYDDPNISNTYPTLYFLTEVSSQVHCIRLALNTTF